MGGLLAHLCRELLTAEGVVQGGGWTGGTTSLNLGTPTLLVLFPVGKLGMGHAPCWRERGS